MKKILFAVACLITLFGYSQGGPRVDAVKFKDAVTTAVRDGFDVPVGETWLIWNVTTTQFEYAESDDVWNAFGGGFNLANADQTISGTTNRIVNTSTSNDDLTFRQQGTDILRVGGNNDDAVRISGLESFSGNTISFFTAPNLPDVDVGVELASAYSSALVEHSGDIYYSDGTNWLQMSFEGLSSDGTTISTTIDVDVTGDLSVDDLAYNESTWNGSVVVPTRNAVRDVIEEKISSNTVGEPSGSDAILNMVSLTQAEYDAGSPVAGTSYVITDAKIKDVIQIACSDLSTDVTTGTSKAYFRMPWAATLTDVRVSLLAAGTATGITVDINEDGTTVLSTKLTTDATEKTSETAATAAVISDSALADDAEMTIDFDAVPTNGQGVIVTLFLDHD